MLMVFFSEIFIFLVKCNYVFMSENLAAFNAVLKEDDSFCIKSNFLKFAESNEKLGLFLFDKLTAEYKNITGLS